MKANELRIGNTVFYNSENDNNEPVRYYCTINGADLRIMQDDENYLKSHEPIALTPELLEKCGFTKVGSNYEKDWLLLHTHLERQTFNFLLYESSSGKLKATPILYLHQLQNLYFALTGQELDINLEEK